MRPVATVNGVKVYSNKSLRSVVNTRLTFADGSWCDVGTGDVHNNGTGFIRIGSQPGRSESSANQKTWGPESFQAHVLKITGVDADVVIEETDDPSCQVLMTGPENELDNIDVESRGGTLLIQSKTNASDSNMGGITVVGGNISISGTSRGTRIISGRSSVVISGDEPRSVQIKIKAPVGTNLDLSGILGNVTCGDLRSDVTLVSQGGYDARFGEMRSATINVMGSGDVDIKALTGRLDARVMGSGDIKVHSGEVETVSAQVMGSGDIKFKGKTQTANLILMGSGDIRVKHCVQPPNKTKMGNGDIKVKNVG